MSIIPLKIDKKSRENREKSSEAWPEGPAERTESIDQLIKLTPSLLMRNPAFFKENFAKTLPIFDEKFINFSQHMTQGLHAGVIEIFIH